MPPSASLAPAVSGGRRLCQPDATSTCAQPTPQGWGPPLCAGGLEGGGTLARTVAAGGVGPAAEAGVRAGQNGGVGPREAGGWAVYRRLTPWRRRRPTPGGAGDADAEKGRAGRNTNLAVLDLPMLDVLLPNVLPPQWRGKPEVDWDPSAMIEGQPGCSGCASCGST